MRPSDSKRVLELADLLCDERITPEQFQELDAILAEDAEARTIYADFIRMHHRLGSGALDEKPAPGPAKGVRRFRPSLAVAVLATAALVVLSAVTLLQSPAPTSPATEASAAVAVLTRAIDVEWDHPTRFQAVAGKPIDPGWLRLASGIAEITFSSGATVTLQGPGRLRIDEPLHCFSKGGKLTAHCPESAYGFTVRFPGGRVVDLGTEFALESKPEGRTHVHVLNGEVKVALTGDSEQVIQEQSLLEKTSVTLDPGNAAIHHIDYDASSFTSIQRESLLRSQPIKLQFDLGHRAGLYSGTNAPAHAAGDMLAHETTWTQIVGDQSGTFIMADGNICPHPITVDYGHGDGKIEWQAEPVDPWGKIHSKATGIFDSTLCQDHRPWDFDLGLRVSGLPAGTYRIYALCRSARRPSAAYDVSFGVNLHEQVESPLHLPPMDPDAEPVWQEGLTYEVEDITVSGPQEWLTFITRYSRERSVRSTPHHGRSVLLGLQIVQVR